jgi:hypothetical protein
MDIIVYLLSISSSLRGKNKNTNKQTSNTVDQDNVNDVDNAETMALNLLNIMS